LIKESDRIAVLIVEFHQKGLFLVVFDYEIMGAILGEKEGNTINAGRGGVIVRGVDAIGGLEIDNDHILGGDHKVRIFSKIVFMDGE